MEAVRECAERYLFELAVFRGSHGPDPLPRSLVRAQIDAQRREHFELAARAFVAIGALAEADVAPLRERLEQELARGVPGPPVAVDEALVQRARVVLQSCLEDVAAQTQADYAAGGRDGVRDARVHRFARVWEACLELGVLDRGELDALWAELREADRGRTEGLRRRHLVSPCTLGELVTVLAGPASGGGRLRVLAVELYADGVVVRWHWHGGTPNAMTDATLSVGGSRFPRHHQEASLSDDLGQVYLCVRSPLVGHFARPWIYGESTFATQVPPAATKLFFDVADEHVSVVLPGAGGDA